MSHDLNVLIATPAFAPAYRYGGPVLSTEGLVLALHALGVRVRVLTTDANGPETLAVPRGWTEWKGIPVLYTRRWREPDLSPRFFPESLLGARRADVVHVIALFSTPSMAALLAASVVRKPVVFAPKGALQQEALASGAAAAKRAWLRAAKPLLRSATLLAASREEESAIRRTVDPQTVVDVVPNGTTIEPLEIARQRRTAAQLGPKKIGALGRIHPIKGFDRLIDAVAILGERGHDVRLEIAGPTQDHAHKAELERRAAQGALAGRVAFVGPLEGDAKKSFLAGCSALALPSHSENFGIVVIESLAQLTPVVASKGTPWSELEVSGAGRWVSNEPTALADALEDYLSQEASEQAGERGRKLVEAKYAWEGVAAQMVGVYERAIRRRA